MEGQETYSLNFGIYQNKNVMTKSGDDCNVTFSFHKQNKGLGPFMSIATLYKINSLHMI